MTHEIQTHLPTAMSTLCIAQICLANAFRDEQTEEYRCGKRLAKYQRVLRDTCSSTDVYSIKELRACRNPSGDKMLSAQGLLNELLSPTPELAQACCFPVKVHRTTTKKNGPYSPFYLAQVYNTERVTLLDSGVNHYYEQVFGDPTSPPAMGGCYIWGKYAPNRPDGFPDLTKTFVVKSFHLPFANDDKTKVCEYLCRALHTKDPPPVVIAVGDFNFFRDDKDHALHLQLWDKNFQNVSEQRLVSYQTGKRMFGTFWPFPHDVPPVKLDLPTEDSKHTSVLDHVFLSRGSETKLLSETCRLVEPTDYAHPEWDHLPLFFSFKWTDTPSSQAQSKAEAHA